MFGIPPACELKKQLPKKTIYAKFHLNAAQRDSFDKDIARIDIVAVISPATIPALALGEEVGELYVLHVHLKHKEYDSRNIALLSKLIPQKMVFALHCDKETQFAVFHTKLLMSAWHDSEQAALPISGLNIDSVWENIVKNIGLIEVDEDKTLVEQIAANDQRDKTLAQIARLQRKIANEKQPRRKREYFNQISNIRKQMP